MMRDWRLVGLRSFVGFAASLAGCSMALFAHAARADEGMWLINALPKEQLKERYGFEPSAAWLEKAQHAAVKVGQGGSGSFVSARGLVMTNHHVASEAIQKLTTAERNLMRDGFIAKSEAEELRVEGQEISMLVSIRDVSEQINAAAEKDAGNPQAAEAARQAEIGRIESEESKKSGLNCRVVPLFGGGLYHLYSVKRFTDVRLVFAPEELAASYGGDADNFEYPRFGLDMAFFRVYENGKPYQPKHYFTFNAQGAKEGEAVFVVGHPGRTQRLLTVDDLRFLRDYEYPARLAEIWRTEVHLREFMGRSKRNALVAGDDYDGVANGRKARQGQLRGLQDPALMKTKIEAQEKLFDMNIPEVQKAISAVSALSAAKKPWREGISQYLLLNRGMPGELSSRALRLVLRSEEVTRESAQRLREFRDARLEETDEDILTEVPMDEAFETALLSSWLSRIVELRGGDDQLVRSILGNQTAQRVAFEAISGTKLKDQSERKRLLLGGAEAIKESTDPLIVLARKIAPAVSAIRKGYERTVEPAEREAYARLAEARFKVLGQSVAPDATGTLRVSFGVVKGYMQDGEKVPAFTTFQGLIDRAKKHEGEAEYALVPRFQAAAGKFNPSTPYNFVCTADIIGGNSGSPVLNTKGEVVGLIFDGNIESLPNAFLYSEERARAVSVDVRAILESLRVVYDAKGLLTELETGK